VEVRVFSTAPTTALQNENSVAISEKEIMQNQLRLLNTYYSELSKLASLEPHEEITRLWYRANNHIALHTQLLFDALILDLCNILDSAGWNPKSRESEKITLDHFVRKLPSSGQQRAKAEEILKETKSLPAYANIQKARNNFIAHPNLKMQKDYTTPEEVFPNLTLVDFGELLERVRQIALVAVDAHMDFFIPGFEGVDGLLRIVRRALGEV
jgi:AbiU2